MLNLFEVCLERRHGGKQTEQMLSIKAKKKQPPMKSHCSTGQVFLCNYKNLTGVSAEMDIDRQAADP